ncbi:uncharacterized protein [Asterias amurensis]|uniref:uncharacterized protein isoform X1 n=1 Tax=Asterias amurensis TaxID=7602 RepID=UPI003AB48584
MGRLTCQCLNISVHTKAVPTPLKLAELRLTPEEQSDDFFRSDVAEVQLDLGGIAEAQRCLIRRYPVGNWVVRTCLNCEMECYATHISKGLNRILVSLNLEGDTAKQEDLQRSTEFSPLYHLILRDVNKISSPTLGLPMTSNQDALKKTAGDLQDQLTRYLAKEKSSMEARIKKYTEDQQHSYTAVQKKAYRDKNVMVGLIIEADEKCLEDSISEAMLEATLTPPQTPVSIGSNKRVVSHDSSKIASSPRSLHSRAPTSKSKSETTVLKAYGSSHPTAAAVRQTSKPSRGRTNDADTIFDLDGFNDDCDPFFESDDESSTDDSSHVNPTHSLPPDNSLNDDHLGHVMARRDQTRTQNYAASVPISMPMWNREGKASYEDDDDEDKVPMPEPDRMVASMRALSFSVQDGTEMFGDLPRPRLNTGDTVSLSKKINL